MKIRSGFVSNSSSSSFIVIGKEPENIAFVKLQDEKVINNILNYMNEERDHKIVWDGKEPVYLTEHVSDCCDIYPGGEDKYDVYLDGDLSCEPYGYDEYDAKDNFYLKIAEDGYKGIFIRKIDYQSPIIEDIKSIDELAEKLADLSSILALSNDSLDKETCKEYFLKAIELSK